MGLAERGFGSLGHREFRILWQSVALSNCGRWALTMALGWYLQVLTASPFLVGLGMFMIQGPALLGAPLGGVLADRLDRRHVLIGAYLLSAIGCALLSVVLLSGLHSAALVILVAGITGLAFSVQNTTYNAMAPVLVPRPRLLNAVSMVGMARQGAEFVGPAVTAPLMMLASGPALVFLVSAGFYLAAALHPLFIRPLPARSTAVAAGLLQPLRDGVGYVRDGGRIGLIVGIVALHCTTTMAFMGVLPAFVQQTLHQGSGTYSTLMTVIGLGAIAGAMGSGMLQSRRHQANLFVFSALFSGLGLIALAVSRSLDLAIVSALAMGFAQSAFMALSQTRLQEYTSDDFRGRVSGVYAFFTMGSMAAANWGLGALGTSLPPAWIMAATGGLFTVVILAASPVSQNLRAIYGGAPDALPAASVV